MCDTPKATEHVPPDDAEEHRGATVVRFPHSASNSSEPVRTNLRLLTDIANALDVPISSLLETSQSMIDADGEGTSDRVGLVAAFDEIHDPAVRQQIVRFVKSYADQARATPSSGPTK